MLLQPVIVLGLPIYGNTLTFGGSPNGDVSVYGLAMDSTGNIYLSGTFYDTVDFNPGVGIDNKTSPTNYDAFVTKFNSDGSYGYTYSYAASGTASSADAVAVDSNNNVYLTGYFRGSVDFNPGVGVDTKTSSEAICGDAFISKINADGSYGYTYAYGGGGSTCDGGLRLAIDSNNNVFFGGHFSGSVDFDPTGVTDNQTASGYQGGFVSKINFDGSYGYTYTFPGNADQAVYGLGFDQTGNLAIGLNFKGTADLNPTGGLNSSTSAGNYDVALIKMSAAGGYLSSSQIGAGNSDFLKNLSYSATGELWYSGFFSGTVDFNPGAGTDSKATPSANIGAFYSNFDSSGNYVSTTTFFNSTDEVSATAVIFDSYANAYLLGSFAGSVDFNPGAGTDNKTAQGYDDTFMTVLGSDESYSGTQVLTGNNSVVASGGVVNSQNVIYLAGYHDSTSTDFDPTSGVDNHPAVGFYDSFLTKLSGTPPPPPAPPPVTSPSPSPATPSPPASAVVIPEPVLQTDDGLLLNQISAFSSSEGVEVILTDGDIVTFTLPAGDTETHTATIQSIGEDYVDIIIASEPISLRLNVGETRLVDVNRNGKNDLSITLASLVGQNARIIFKQLSIESLASPEKAVSSFAKTTASSVNKNNNSPNLVLAAIGISAVVLGYLLIKSQRRNKV